MTLPVFVVTCHEGRLRVTHELPMDEGQRFYHAFGGGNGEECDCDCGRRCSGFLFFILVWEEGVARADAEDAVVRFRGKETLWMDTEESKDWETMDRHIKEDL